MWKYAGLVIGVLVGTAFLGGGPLFAQADEDPVLGTWVLNRAKSTFVGNLPEGRTITFERASNNAIRVITRTLQANGGTDQIEYTAAENGKDYPISNSILDTIALERINARTVERFGKVRGRVVETRTRVLSPDGKTLTITTKGTYRGIPYRSVQMFDRQPSAMMGKTMAAN